MRNTEISRKPGVSRLEVEYAVKMGRKLPARINSVCYDKDTYFLMDVIYKGVKGLYP
jgi:hypothetical protein